MAVRGPVRIIFKGLGFKKTISTKNQQKYAIPHKICCVNVLGYVPLKKHYYAYLMPLKQQAKA